MSSTLLESDATADCSFRRSVVPTGSVTSRSSGSALAASIWLALPSGVAAAFSAGAPLPQAAAIAATHDTGQLRFNGRKHELPAIDALEAHVIDPSNEQSATAVLDKISGAALIAARQRQARVQLLAGVVEQLLIDTKRARDAGRAAPGAS